MARRSNSARGGTLSRRGRGVVLSTLVFLAAAQSGLLCTMSFWRQELRDPQYGYKLARLRKRLIAKDPAAPLVVALGSSRIGMGIHPETLTETQSEALIF